MAEITMPKLSDTMTEGTLVAWKKKKGDKVSMGEVLAEVETDKATMEMEAFEDGVLAEIFIQAGQKVAVGDRLAVITVEGEAPAAKGQPEALASDSVQPIQPVEKRTPATSSAPASTSAKAGDSRIKASPLARKVAAANGVDLSAITGTGPGGRIIERDVAAAQPSAPQAAAAAPAKPAAAPAPRPGLAKPSATGPVASQSETRIPLSSMRKVIADRLLESKTRIPHFYLHAEVDAGPLARLRAELNAAGEKDGNKFSLNDLILKAAAGALVRVPKVNASFAGDAIVEYGSVFLAVAVAVEDGLVTPVIRDAQRKSLSEISLAMKDLAARARAKKLKPEEYQGGTFTVSNLGSFGIDSFDAIINPPQAAILSVGGLVKKPVVNAAGEVVAGQRLDLGLSCDHRVVDGALGAQFLAAMRYLIEQPLLLLL